MVGAIVWASMLQGSGSPSGISAGKFEGPIVKQASLQYLVSVPDDYETSRGKRYPLLVFLHGSGERGTNLELLKVHGPLKLAAAGKKFPFIVVAPQCPERRSWDADELVGLLNDLEKKFRVDRSREYLTGISMGGYGTWALVAAQPKRFAAIAPVCGGGDPKLAPTFAKVPTWVVHGDKDPAVAFSQSVAMVDAMKAAGGSPIFTQVVGGTHDVWTEFYLKDEFYEWLLKFRRR
jgi:predicted peptidase